jgi:hypothetical protein
MEAIPPAIPTGTHGSLIGLYRAPATHERPAVAGLFVGACSGWHNHPGVIIVTLESGSVTVMDSSCNSVTYGRGLPDGVVFVEGGDDPLQVTSASGATEYAMQIALAAKPSVSRVEDDPPPCATE